MRDKMKALYFVDDNFISRTRYTKDLLKELAVHKKKHGLIEWSAETTLNVSKDEELLDLFQEAGCSTLIIGFESISEATLLDMDKKVNFCLSYQEAIHRIHSRGMSIVGNFIVGFDTDTLEVFEDILQFCEENKILYPFFSILTPMPGTKLHEDFHSANRLDHYDWADYDTRHVVYGPENMTRDQLMDGYCYMYEEAYASQRALNRMQDYWQTYRKSGSSFIERAFIKSRLRSYKGAGSDRFQWLMKEGWKTLLANKGVGDVGQLLYYLDSGNFCDYLDQFRSKHFEDNVKVFRNPPKLEDKSQDLLKKQWNYKQANTKKEPLHVHP